MSTFLSTFDICHVFELSIALSVSIMSNRTAPELVSCPYEAMDLLSELVKLVKRQFIQWPKDITFNSQTNTRALKTALLDPYNSFTTMQLLLSKEHLSSAEMATASVQLPFHPALSDSEALLLAVPPQPLQITDSNTLHTDLGQNLQRTDQLDNVHPQFISVEAGHMQQVLTVFIEDV
ncbi:hypothetical protein DXG01_011747 [Tephrocybe rancida]|nr:hypothetical protein DXG01_011747 [Tephrocybe rancida]